ncbi:hypothetical protein QQ045_014301 [Rhodiola kirilowii]
MMAGFGSSTGHGGFTASSNLSPLAPPFTVDRATSRSDLNINALPYGTPYTASHTNWGQSHAKDYEPSPVSEAFLSSYITNSSIYSASPSAKPQIDHVVFPSPLPDSISFSQFPSSLINNDFRDGNYYAPPSAWDKSSVMVQNELGYKSSSNLNSVGITQVNYTQSLYGLQYPPSQWDHSWDGGLDLETAGKNKFIGRIDPEAPNFTSASTYSNYFKEGSKLSKVLGKASGESCIPQINNFIDMKNQVRSLGTDAVVEKPFSDFNATKPSLALISTIPSRTSGISFPETSDGSNMDSWGCLIPPTATNGTFHKQHYLNDCPSALASFGGITIRQPSVSTSSSFTGSLPPQNTVKHDLSGNYDDIVYDRFHKDFWVSQRSKQGLEIKKCTNTTAGSIDLQRYDSNVMLFPTKYGEPSNTRSVTSGALDVPKYKDVTDVHGNIHNLEGFSLLIDESDQYNPSEDSPCWKGSSSYFAPFQVPETVPSQNHMKSLNSYDGLNLNEPQSFSGNPTTLFSTDFHEKTTQNTTGCLGEADALPPATESGYDGNHLYGEPKSDLSHATNKLGATEGSSGNWCSFATDNHISVEADAVDTESFRVKKPEFSNPIRLCLETICCGSDREKAPGCLLDTDLNLNDAPEECQSNVPSKAAKQVLSSLSSDADMSSKHNQENRVGYAPELKPMLLKTILDLSDLLLFNYSNDDAPVGNEDHKILERVLSQLTICLKHAQEKSWIKESSILGRGPSNNSNGVQTRQCEMTNKPQVTDVKSHEDGTMLGSKIEGVHKPVRANAREETGSMTKAIKEVLAANFHEDTESQPLASIYKNLWLEAEAALCCTNYKARFHHMKIEIEKSTSQEEKEKSPECKVPPSHVEVFQESLSASRTLHAADIMERYNILRCRVETSNERVGGEMDSSKISSDQRTADKLSDQVDSITTSDTFSKDAITGSQSHVDHTINVSGQQNPTTSLTNTYGADMAEDHVMGRLQILKSRGDYPKYIASEKQPSEFSTEFVGKTDISPLRWGTFMEISDRRFKPAFGTEMTKAKGVLSVAGCGGVECASGSQPNCENLAQNSEIVEPGAQFSGGWYETTSSDWEHVLKDEFAWNAGPFNP